MGMEHTDDGVNARVKKSHQVVWRLLHTNAWLPSLDSAVPGTEAFDAYALPGRILMGSQGQRE